MKRFKVLSVATLISAITIPVNQLLADSSGGATGGSYVGLITSAPDATGSTVYGLNDGLGCRSSLPQETAIAASRDLTQPLARISPVELNAQTGLKIVLRATPQLESFPQAKAAFLRGAATWQSIVKTPITVVVDVDFGSTWFGQPYPSGVLGLTSPQMLMAPGIYPAFARALLDSASSEAEKQTYAALPQGSVPTDIGDTNLIYAPSSLYRVLGFIDAVADPAIETGYGPPPAVGFNAAFNYDFDPNDGIDPGKVDFDAVVTHELGHVLGFASFVGQKEMNDNLLHGVTVWDLFRFRPGANMSIFSTAPRIMSSGGLQVHFAGSADLELSTGRPDQSGGDGRQASHWKDDELTGRRLGVMDPTIPAGTRVTISSRDIAAIDCFGYELAQFDSHPPKVEQLGADLHGDVLSLSGKLTDADGDVAKAELQLFDEKSRLLGTTAPFDVDFGVTETFFFDLQFTGMNSSPLAMKAGLVLIDTRSNRSAVVIADFSGADDGGPKLKKASYENKLKAKGKRLAGELQIEINGVVLPPTVHIQINSTGKKLTIEAPSGDLNLHPGPNRVRVTVNGLRSNLAVLTLE